MTAGRFLTLASALAVAGCMSLTGDYRPVSLIASDVMRDLAACRREVSAMYWSQNFGYVAAGAVGAPLGAAGGALAGAAAGALVATSNDNQQRIDSVEKLRQLTIDCMRAKGYEGSTL